MAKPSKRKEIIQASLVLAGAVGGFIFLPAILDEPADFIKTMAACDSVVGGMGDPSLCRDIWETHDATYMEEVGLTQEYWDRLRDQLSLTNIISNQLSGEGKVYEYESLLREEDRALLADYDLFYDFSEMSKTDRLSTALYNFDQLNASGEDIQFSIRRFVMGYESSPEYLAWEEEALSNIIVELAQHPHMHDWLSALGGRRDATSREQAMEQWQIRQNIGNEIYRITAENFGVEAGSLIFYPIPDDLPVLGFASPRLNGIVLNYNLDLERFGSEFTEENWKTVAEEIKHMIDIALVRLYEDGSLERGHPAYDHARVLALNGLDYISPGYPSDYYGYYAQYIEDNAKQYASRFAEEIMQCFSPEQASIDEAQNISVVSENERRMRLACRGTTPSISG